MEFLSWKFNLNNVRRRTHTFSYNTIYGPLSGKETIFMIRSRDLKQLLTFYIGNISFSTLSHVEYNQHIYVLGNIYLFYVEGDSNSHRHSLYLRNDVAAFAEFAGRLIVGRYSTLLSLGKFK